MKKIIIMCVALGLLYSCSERDQAKTFGDAEDAPLVNTITNDSILAPSKLAVVGDKLMMMQSNTSHIFYFFSLPEVDFLYSWGIHGGGPEDFRTPFESTLNADGEGFDILDPPAYKYISVVDNKPKLERKETINAGFFNSFAKIDSTTFVYNSKHNADYEFIVEDKKTNSTKEFDNSLIKDLDPNDKNEPINVLSGKLIAGNKNGKIAVFYKYLPLVKYFNSKGELLQSFYVDEYLKKENKDKKMFYADMIYDEDNIYCLYVNKTKKEMKKNIDDYTPEIHIFDWDGNVVKKYAISKPITSFAVDVKNKMIYGYSPFNSNENEVYVFKMK